MTAKPVRLAAVRLMTSDAARLCAFYGETFGFAVGPQSLDRLGEGVIQRLTLGGRCIEVLTPTKTGRPYPDNTAASDTIFQHIALVVPDMAIAMARLNRASGWTPISTHGPEHLPDSSGGVVAFKFRDPDGHPLEFLQFPADAVPAAWQQAGANRICLGYDHSAITVSDTTASRAFYARLGLAPGAHSLNEGPEQSRMDGQPDAVVEVTGLFASDSPPHLELLCYRKAAAHTPTSDADIAATRLVFELPDAEALEKTCAELSRVASLHRVHRVHQRDGASAALLRDPDGHRLWLTQARHRL